MCPSDSNGVYSLPDGYTAVTGEVIQASQHNPPLEDLASAMSLRLMRTGVAPMTGPLKIADGSVGSPGLKFGSDGLTGLYKTVNGFGVSVSGTKVAEFNAGGVSRYLGELIPFTGLTAQAFSVFPYGQTLSRTAYPDLWAFAQTEIGGGNTFYNNGNGTTTFGIGDMRGRVAAGKDDMGGTAAGRLGAAAGFNTDAKVLGASGGLEYHTLSQDQLPAVSPTFAGITDTVTVTSTTSNWMRSSSSILVTGTSTLVLNSNTSAITSEGSFTPRGTISALGSGVSHNNVQPTLICNYLLYAGA